MDNELSRPVYELISRGDFQWINHIKRTIDLGGSNVCDPTLANLLSKELIDNPTPSEARLKELFEKTGQIWPEASGLSDHELKLAARNAIASDTHICSYEARVSGNHKKANELYLTAESIRTGTENSVDKWMAKVDLQILKQETKLIPTGFVSIDKAFHGGIETGTYNIITAESNIGKTIILTNLANHYIKDGKRVLYVTFEETERAIMRRFAQNILKIDMFSVPKINNWQTSILANTLENLTIVAEDSGTLTVDSFLSDMKTLTEKPDIIILDYYVHFKTNPKNETHEEVGRISKALVAYAKEANIQIWTAAQSNREGYSKKESSLANIGKSIESVQVADTVFCAKIENDIPTTEDTYVLKLIIQKDRQGANRTLPMFFEINKKFQSMTETSGTVDITQTSETDESFVKKVKIHKPKAETIRKNMEMR